ncbi:MAG: TonB-dependent receptor [Halieaceae bacterium]|jgi:iron complex outermembrane receptor protein|nr:TonB-dependent receptor [Halieaceae bacterium]
MSKKNHAQLLGLGVIFLTGSVSVLAQDSALEEVVVTATKRSVALQDLAGSANVLGADKLGPGGIQEVRDMQVEIPNLSLGDQFGFARVFMRGIGMTSIDIGGEGAVAFLQDGAIIPRPAAQLMGMFDLDQVEVLRGPQGTLYGRGATGGAINMVTAKPGKELGGYLSVTAGNYSLAQFKGAIDVPMGDALSMRLAASLDSRDGYGNNIFTGSDINDRDASAYRATFVYDAGGPLTATLSAQYYEEDDNNYAFSYFGQSEGSSIPVPFGVPILGGNTVGMAGGGFYDINSDQEPINDRDGQLINLTIDYAFNDSWSLKSITSSQSMDRFLRDDLDSTDANLFGQNNYTEESDSFGQELILNYSSDRFDVLSGVMYFEEDLYGEVRVPLTNLCFLLAPDACGTPIGDFLNGGNYLQDGDVDIEAWGAYVEANYSISDKWSLIAGLRYNYEERDGTGSFIFDAISLNVPTNQRASWNDLTPRITLQYSPNDNMLLYATYTEAFKSGVINTGSTSPPLDPETVDAFEVGLKGQNASGTLRYSVAAFFYDYQDMQISFVDETSTVSTVNAAEAENSGIELEVDGSLGNGFAFDFYLTYLNAEYQEFFNGDYANGFAITDLSGNTLPNAPESTAKLGLTWEGAVAGGTLTVRGEAYYQDDVYFTEWNRKDAYQKSYEQFNASMDYSWNDQWLLSLWGRNLSDEEVMSNNIITAPLYDSLRVGAVLPPRTYGATVTYQF